VISQRSSEAMSRRRKTNPPMRRERAGVAIAIATLACGGLAACGGSSQIATVGTRAISTAGRSVAIPSKGRGKTCARKAGIRFVGTQIRVPKGMSGAQLKTILRECGFVRPSIKGKGKPARKAKVKAPPSVTQLIAEFAACMRQNGVNVRPPTLARPDPQLDTRGINTRSLRVRAASRTCSHYLRVGVPHG
jgi:hypothetical protein